MAIGLTFVLPNQKFGTGIFFGTLLMCGFVFVTISSHFVWFLNFLVCLPPAVRDIVFIKLILKFYCPIFVSLLFRALVEVMYR